MYTFGPVNSRRFGLSLGIDLSPNTKQCNFDCLYCELDRAQTMTVQSDVAKVEDIVKDVKKALMEFENIDVLTLTANGEPTLYPHLDELANELNKIKQDTKLLILSNGAKITEPNLQKTLQKIDIVKLSLDAVTPKIFKKIDKAHKSLDIGNIINAMVGFRKVHKNDLIIEVLVVKDVNDSVIEFSKINDVLKKIMPNRVDISTIDRPPAYTVNPVPHNMLEILASCITNQNIVVVGKRKDNKKFDFTCDELLNTSKKRPYSNLDVEAIFSDISKQNIEKLLEDDKLFIVKVGDVKFYKRYKND